LIQKHFGGSVGYRKSTDSYYYGSVSFESALKVVNYFDKYHLLSSKYLNYLKWRKAYYIISRKEHLIEKGIIKIKSLKDSMNSYKHK